MEPELQLIGWNFEQDAGPNIEIDSIWFMPTIMSLMDGKSSRKHHRHIFYRKCHFELEGI